MSLVSPSNAERPVEIVAWAAACVAAVLLSTFAFACASPLAGLAAIAGLKFSRGNALTVAGIAWLANQIVGFVFLGYPTTADSFAWGAVMGVGTLVAAAVAHEGRRIRMPALQLAVAFVAAFVAYQIVLAAAVPVLGGIEAFAPAIVARILAINAAAFFALAALGAAVAAIVPRERGVALAPSRG